MSETRDLRKAFVVDAAPPPKPGVRPPPVRVVPTDSEATAAAPPPRTAHRVARRATRTPLPSSRLTPVRLLVAVLVVLLVAVAALDAYRFLAGAFADSLLLGVTFSMLFAALLGAAGWAVVQLRAEIRTIARTDGLRAQGKRVLRGGDGLELAAQDYIGAVRAHYAGDAAMQERLEEFDAGLDSSLQGRLQVERLSCEVFRDLDARAFGTVVRRSQQAALLAALSRVPLADFLISLWRSLALVREVAGIYGGRPGATGLLRLWRDVLYNLVYAEVSELAADAVSQVVGESATTRLSAQVAQGVGMGILIGRLGLEAIKVCRPVPFTGREAQQPRLRVLVEGLKQLVKSGFAKPEPTAATSS
ncbi:MAG: TIGR01620 family protein [Gammaproteobacteria bacterium]|jgi:putative membrane protein|nr:TIGR01620 family protein [Gammaproteobacteria bacterium]